VSESSPASVGFWQTKFTELTQNFAQADEEDCQIHGASGFALLDHFTGVSVNEDMGLVLHVVAAGVLGGVCAVVGGVAGVETAGVSGG